MPWWLKSAIFLQKNSDGSVGRGRRMRLDSIGREGSWGPVTCISHSHDTTMPPHPSHQTNISYAGVKKSSSTCAQKGCQRHNLGYWVLNPFNSVNIHEPPEGQIGPAIKPNSSCMLLDKMILFGFNILLLNFSLTMPWGPLDCRMFVHPSLRAVQSMLAIREAILIKKVFVHKIIKWGRGMASLRSFFTLIHPSRFNFAKCHHP